jgi:hypothetical protein
VKESPEASDVGVAERLPLPAATAPGAKTSAVVATRRARRVIR